MKKIAISILILLPIIFSIANLANNVYAASCVPTAECKAVTSDSDCSAPCTTMGLVCCKSTSGSADFSNWQNILFNEEEKKNFKILGIEMTGEEAQSLIRTLFLVAISGLALLFIGVTAYGSFLWITAADSEEKLQKAKKVIKSGLIAILIAFGFIVLLAIFAGILGLDILNFTFLDKILGE